MNRRGIIPPGKEVAEDDRESRLRLFATKRRNAIKGVHPRERHGGPAPEVGIERTSTAVAAPVDTNILVYRFDGRFPEKRKIAMEILRRGIADYSVHVPGTIGSMAPCAL